MVRPYGSQQIITITSLAFIFVLTYTLAWAFILSSYEHCEIFPEPMVYFACARFRNPYYYFLNINTHATKESDYSYIRRVKLGEE